MSRLGVLAHLWPAERHLRAIEDERALRAPLPVIRRIAFVSLRGGTGCTTAATAVAHLLRSRRRRGILHVDASGDEPTPGATDPSTLVVPGPVWPRGTDRWQEHCGAAHRDSEITVTDWGSPGASALTSIAAHSHVVCLTTTTERAPVQEALDAASALNTSGTPTLIVASAVRGRHTIATTRMLTSSPVPILVLPSATSRRETPATAVAVAALSAEILRHCIRSEGWDRAA